MLRIIYVILNKAGIGVLLLCAASGSIRVLTCRTAESGIFEFLVSKHILYGEMFRYPLNGSWPSCQINRGMIQSTEVCLLLLHKR